MALTSSGQIDLNAMHVEAGGTTGTECTLNDADIRGLISKAAGAQNAFNEYYGASSGIGAPTTKSEGSSSYTVSGANFQGGDIVYDHVNSIWYNNYFDTNDTRSKMSYSTNGGSSWTTSTASGYSTTVNNGGTMISAGGGGRTAAWPYGNKGLLSGYWKIFKSASSQSYYWQQNGTNYNVNPSTDSTNQTENASYNVDLTTAKGYWKTQTTLHIWSGNSGTAAAAYQPDASAYSGGCRAYAKGNTIIFPYAYSASPYEYGYYYSTNGGSSWTKKIISSSNSNICNPEFDFVNWNDTDEFYFAVSVNDAETAKSLYKVDISNIGSYTTVTSNIESGTGIGYTTGGAMADNNVMAFVGGSSTNTSYGGSTNEYAKAAFREGGWGSSGWTTFTSTNYHNLTGQPRYSIEGDNNGAWYASCHDFWMKFT